jgi:splicing factor 3A subunit 1
MTTAEVLPANGSQALVAVGTAQTSLPAPQFNDVVDSQTKAIGLIMPPHDIRMIIDKTADFVAKNGVLDFSLSAQECAQSQCVVIASQGSQGKTETRYAGTAFEQKILAQPKNVKFNFLHSTDPYHKYYQYTITEVKEGPEAAKAAFQASNSATAQIAEVVQPQAEEEAPPPTQELKKPEEEKYTAHIPAGLSPQVLFLSARQVIALTASADHLCGHLCSCDLMVSATAIFHLHE